MSNFKFGTRSMIRLRGVDRRLVRVAELALSKSLVDLTIVEGLRSPERQAELYAKGRTTPGPKVSWTMKSKHLEGKAIDVAPLEADGSIDWNNAVKFKTMADLMFAAADELGVHIRWGCDWDQDGIPYEKGEYDGPHFELVD